MRVCVCVCVRVTESTSTPTTFTTPTASTVSTVTTSPSSFTSGSLVNIVTTTHTPFTTGTVVKISKSHHRWVIMGLVCIWHFISLVYISHFLWRREMYHNIRYRCCFVGAGRNRWCQRDDKSCKATWSFIANTLFCMCITETTTTATTFTSPQPCGHMQIIAKRTDFDIFSRISWESVQECMVYCQLKSQKSDGR